MKPSLYLTIMALTSTASACGKSSTEGVDTHAATEGPSSDAQSDPTDAAVVEVEPAGERSDDDTADASVQSSPNEAMDLTPGDSEPTEASASEPPPESTESPDADVGDPPEPGPQSNPPEGTTSGSENMPEPDDTETPPEPTPVAERSEGPCDIYGAAGNLCVAAYSTVRALTIDYDGPLYQVRSGSNATNPGEGGELHDITMTADGFADAAAQDAVCEDTVCTISLIYDQSGQGNDLPVANQGGESPDEQIFESLATAGPLTVAGRNLYSLYMDPGQSYRQFGDGNGIPVKTEPRGIYMLADGSRAATGCCWEFGNVDPVPPSFSENNALFFGVGFWGTGAGDGPWFMSDFEVGLWAGGSDPGDPGWGRLSDPGPPNEDNPSLNVRFALGFQKTDMENDQVYAIRVADVGTARAVTTAFEGGLPKPIHTPGGILIGGDGVSSSLSFGTFYEGAMVLGYPTNAVEEAVMQNIQAADYGR